MALMKNNEKQLDAEYRAYINNHILNVKRANELFGNKIAIEIFYNRKHSNTSIKEIMDGLKERIPVHDASKFSNEEFKPYRDKFFGNDRNSKSVENAFEKAWIHHYTINDHHPEFWTYKLGKKIITASMSNCAFAEMLIDWIAMSMANNSSLIDWWMDSGKADKIKYFDQADMNFLDQFIIKYEDDFNFKLNRNT